MSCETCKWDAIPPDRVMCRSPHDELYIKEGVAPDGSYWCYELRLSETSAINTVNTTEGEKE